MTEEKTTISIFKTDLLRLVALKAHPREVAAETFNRTLDVLMGCQGMAPLSSDNLAVLTEVYKKIQKGNPSASVLDATELIFKKAIDAGLLGEKEEKA